MADVDTPTWPGLKIILANLRNSVGLVQLIHLKDGLLLLDGGSFKASGRGAEITWRGMFALQNSKTMKKKIKEQKGYIDWKGEQHKGQIYREVRRNGLQLQSCL